MKKLLVLISLILCLSMLFVACGENTGDENSQPEENVEANVSKLVDELNKAETLEELLNTTVESIDYKELIAELKKISAEGSMDLTATADGEEVGGVTGSFAIKDNVLFAEANNGYETYGINGSISDAYKLAYALWYVDEEDNSIEVGDAMAFDIEAIMDEMMAMVEEMSAEAPEGAEASPAGAIMGILSELKLPEFTEESITHDNGKYILNKNFLYDAVVATVDSFMDAAKDEGLIPEEGAEEIEAQIQEYKDMAKKVVEAVDFQIYFLVKNEEIIGLGGNVNLKAAELAEALEMDVEEMGTLDYVKASAEISLNGAKASMEYKETEDSHVNKINYEQNFIFDGEEICGYDLAFDIDVVSKSTYEGGDDSYTYSHTYNDSTKMSVTMKIDLSAFDKANATVIDMTVASDTKSENTDKQDGIVTYSRLSSDNIEFTLTLKTTEPNKANLVMSGNSSGSYSYKNGSEVDNDMYDNSIGLTGTVEFKTEGVTVPAPEASVQDAMDEAEVITSVQDFSGHKEVDPETYPEDEYYVPSYPDYVG